MQLNLKRALAVIFACIIFSPIGETFAAKAEDIDVSKYSPVLDDLKKDESFTIENYPKKENDYTLDVTTIAEGENKELFIYVYQPSGKDTDFHASSINISTTIGDEIEPRNYSLTYLNSNNTLYKYLVNDFTVSKEEIRYYEIYSIFRPFDERYDEPTGNSNTVSEISYEVAKKFKIYEENGEYLIESTGIETITVTDKFVGYCRYPEGFSLYRTSCDAHFVAFDTDKPIDKLIEAQITFSTQFYERGSEVDGGERYKEKINHPSLTLSYTQKGTNGGAGWFTPVYEWDRIESIEQFIQEVEEEKNVYSGAILNVSCGQVINEEVKKDLKRMKWVLRFYETDYIKYRSPEGELYESQTFVSDVSILRLEFETNGVHYNLGVIDNKQTGSKDPINETKININDNIILYIIVIALGVFLIIDMFLAFKELKDNDN